MTDILKSFTALQSELDVAKTTLKDVDENIKRLIGRDPSELANRQSTKRSNFNNNEERGRPRIQVNHQNEDRRYKNSRSRGFIQENEEPPTKKRSGLSVFQRLSERPVPEDNFIKQKGGMISKVIVTPKEVPSRQERLEAQSKDATSVARNRRIFGSLLGTLQKFQQEETKLKTKEEKRAQLEKKIEEHEIKEKEEIRKERQELFYNRKQKQAEIKMIELKMIRMKEYAAWEESQKKRTNFIYTKAKPHIHFLPRKLKDVHKKLLENSKTELQELIDKKREQVQEELRHIEERGRRIFEPRKFQQDNKEEQDIDDNDENGFDEDDDPMDGTHEIKIEPEEKSPSSIIDNNENKTDNEIKDELNKNGDITQNGENIESEEQCKRLDKETIERENGVDKIDNDSNNSVDNVDCVNPTEELNQ